MKTPQTQVLKEQARFTLTLPWTAVNSTLGGCSGFMCEAATPSATQIPAMWIRVGCPFCRSPYMPLQGHSLRVLSPSLEKYSWYLEG